MKVILPALLLASVAVGVHAATPGDQLTPKQQKELAKALAGKAPGKPLICVSAIGSRDMYAIGDKILIFKVSRDLVYRNTLKGTCRGLGFGQTLVTRIHGNQYCRGDIADVVDLQSGIPTGSCTLGDFVPYRTAGKGKG